MSVFLTPKQGTRIPTRSELGQLIKDIVIDAAGEDATVSQPMAEKLAQYLDAIYTVLPPRLSEASRR